jgi:hypothetical protein
LCRDVAHDISPTRIFDWPARPDPDLIHCIQDYAQGRTIPSFRRARLEARVLLFGTNVIFE